MALRGHGVSWREKKRSMDGSFRRCDGDAWKYLKAGVNGGDPRAVDFGQLSFGVPLMSLGALLVEAPHVATDNAPLESAVWKRRLGFVRDGRTLTMGDPLGRQR